MLGLKENKLNLHPGQNEEETETHGETQWKTEMGSFVHIRKQNARLFGPLKAGNITLTTERARSLNAIPSIKG